MMYKKIDYDRISGRDILCSAIGRGENVFVIFKYNQLYFSVETDYFGGDSVCVWKTIEDMINGICWFDWIIDGISDEALRKLVGGSNE